MCRRYVDGVVANDRLKEQVLVRDLASFKWKVAWLRGVEVVDIKVLVRAVMSRGIHLQKVGSLPYGH